MSQQQINRNSDLKQLLDDGYEVAIKSDHLVLYNVPYVDDNKEVKLGTLISVLEVNGDNTTQPRDHKAFFDGEHPCDKDGNKLRHIEHASSHQQLGDGLVAHHTFSSKPREGYRDYHHKMTTYVDMISRHARAIDPKATAQTYIVREPEEADSIFNYADSASTRAGIAAISTKLELGKVGIIGLGGTGSYILDLIAKTPIHEIHLFDGDDFLQHNAFRSPGAASLETLKERHKKVNYLANMYAPMRRGIIPHSVHINQESIDLLDGMDFVFICIDSGETKELVAEKLEVDGVPFIDVGMGIHVGDNKLGGIVRVTTSTPTKRDHFRKRVSFTEADNDDVYAQNIQIADMNALNATLAVIKWKKIFGFYADFDNEHSSNFTIDGNALNNMDKI